MDQTLNKSEPVALAAVLRGGVYENVLRDWKKDANAASRCYPRDGLYNAIGGRQRVPRVAVMVCCSPFLRSYLAIVEREDKA